ncbi:transposase [Streptomyces sp. NPDC058620]|uniref:transposase n=1 Tax=Streptomyces sp. NPDC058620 TaxID=3346560 RepID=UPI003658B842
MEHGRHRGPGCRRNTAADHITTAHLALAQLPKKYRRGRQTLIRTDSAGGTHQFTSWLAQRGRWLSYSVGMSITDAHRQRARAEDRIRAARATGLRNLPLHKTAQNQIWLEIVRLALDLLARMPMLALTSETRRWEPRRLRLRLFSAVAQIATTARRRHLRFARHWPWIDVITDALTRLEALPNPGPSATKWATDSVGGPHEGSRLAGLDML